jgi:chemotaxis protein CheD
MKNNPLITQRRTDNEKHQVGDYYEGPDRYYDQVNEKTIVKIYSGGCYASGAPGEVLVTILGSCVACCLYDPLSKLGGMNHFLVPGSNDNNMDSARFGVHDMELLINSLIKLGASKSRLQAKVFGGASLLNNSARIGAKNIEFIRSFLTREEIEIVSEDLGGNYPRRLHFHPDTGKAMLRKLKRANDLQIIEKEQSYIKNIANQDNKEKDKNDDVTLF